MHLELAIADIDDALTYIDLDLDDNPNLTDEDVIELCKANSALYRARNILGELHDSIQGRVK